MSKTSMGLAALAAALTLSLPAAATAAAGNGTATARVQGRTIYVDLAIDRFAVRHGRPVAIATASSRLYRHGRFRTATKRVSIAVSGGAGCKILTLHLEKLRLTLLGLTVDTSAVNLNITGNSTGPLGKLFCTLARGLKLSANARVARAARALNHHMHHRRMHALRFKARIAPVARASQAQTTCPVLDLTLGPLNLDLLGLFVDLYGPTTKSPVTVTITADPNGGSLGKLFCQLASNAQQSSGSSGTA
jgi:hypothetical protein